MDLRESVTKENLLRAFAGESQARNRYTFAASTCCQEKLHVLEAVFLYTAQQELAHAKVFYSHLKKAGCENVTITANYPVDLPEQPQKLLELARCYRFSRWKTVALIYLPALRPYILTALTTATGLAWKSGVAAEVLCLPPRSLGDQIYYTKYYLDIPELFAWTAVTVALSLILERFLRFCLARWGRGWAA